MPRELPGRWQSGVRLCIVTGLPKYVYVVHELNVGTVR